MFRLSAPLPLALLLLTFTALAEAQEKDRSEDAARKQKAFQLLEEIGEGIPSLRASENRVYLAAAVADLLWSKDEKRARGLFDLATKEILARITAFDPSEPDHHNSYSIIQQLRQETINRIARRDPELALEFLRSTQLPPSSGFDQNRLANERDLELHLAGMIAEKDQAKSLELARSALKKGMSYGVANLLYQLEAKDPKSAQTFYGEILDQLKTEDLQRNHEATSAALGLLNSYQPPRAKDESFRELLDLLLGVFLSPTNNINFVQYHHHNAQALIDLAQKYAPGRVTALQQWSQKAQRTLDPSYAIHRELNEVAQTGSVEQILALAQKYSPQEQLPIYQRAAWKAMSEGNLDRARQLVTEFVKDPSQQRSLLDQIDNQVLWKKISENKLAEARQIAVRVKRIDQRIELFVNLAMNASNNGNRELALELLDEGKALLESSEMSSNKMRLQIQLAQNYSSLDAERSITLLEPIIAQLNELVTAAMVLHGFENQYLKDGEWNNRNYSNLGNLLNSLDESLGQLARTDLESACRLSSRLSRLEIRLAAKVAIAQAVMDGTRAASFPVSRRIVMIR